MKFLFTSLSVFALVLSASEGWGKKYYKHVDDQGIVHYSDKKPKDVDDFESWQVRAEDSQYEVKVVNRGTKRMPIFYAVNAYHGPVEVRLSFGQVNNVYSEPPWPARYVVPANSDLYLATVKPINEQRSWSMRYRIDSALGDPSAKHDEGFAYALPFVGNKNYFVSQGISSRIIDTYGKLKDEPFYKQRGLDILDQMKAEDNKITRIYRGLGMEQKSAYHSQAALQLYKAYCSSKKCLNCSIGIHLIR